MGRDKRRARWQEIIIHIKSIRKNWPERRKNEEKRISKLNKKNPPAQTDSGQVLNEDAAA